MSFVFKIVHNDWGSECISNKVNVFEIDKTLTCLHEVEPSSDHAVLNAVIYSFNDFSKYSGPCYKKGRLNVKRNSN